MSTRCCLFVCLAVILIRFVPATAYTDFNDVQALQGLYVALNSPQQLKGWRSMGGDPCEDPWKGILCNGTSIIHIKIPQQNLTGFLGYQLANLVNLKQLDVSCNNIEGEIPYSLPPSLTHLNMAFNNFSHSISYSLSSLKLLRRVNLSHNSLLGSVGNIFTSLTYLREMDLSFNNLTGDLPSSFGSLTRLTKLFLHSNGFTGSVVYLIGLPLTDLNIQDNRFSGVLPSQFQLIPNLWMGGNRFDEGSNYPTWNFSWENVHNESNVTSPPSSSGLSTIESYVPREESSRRKKQVGPNKFHTMPVDRNNISKVVTINTLKVSILFTIFVTVALLFAKGKCQQIRKPVTVELKLICHERLKWKNISFSDTELTGNSRYGEIFKVSLDDGNVYTMQQIRIKSCVEESNIKNIIEHVPQIRNTFIQPYAGYSNKHGQYFLLYRSVRGKAECTVYDILQSDVPLSWKCRLEICLGIASGLECLHSKLIIHGELRSGTTLLDEDLKPLLSNYAIHSLRGLVVNDRNKKEFERKICDVGYIEPGGRNDLAADMCSTEGDIYAFGVLILELFTRRKPFDSEKPMEEQHLAKWALPQLDAQDALPKIADPLISRTIPNTALLRFANILSMCLQTDKGLRPPISEIKNLVQDVYNLGEIDTSLKIPSPRKEPLKLEFIDRKHPRSAVCPDQVHGGYEQICGSKHHAADTWGGLKKKTPREEESEAVLKKKKAAEKGKAWFLNTHEEDDELDN